MDRIPTLLLIAWLLPLASFTVICIGYSVPQMFGIRVRYATQQYAGYIAIGAIVGGFLLSAAALLGHWLPPHPLTAAHQAEAEVEKEAASTSPFHYALMQTEAQHAAEGH